MPVTMSRRLRSASAAPGATSLPPKPPEPKPDPASFENQTACPNNIQVGGKQYTKVAGLTWVEISRSGCSTPQSGLRHSLMFRWGRPSFRAKIAPPHCHLRLRSPQPTAQAPRRYVPKQYAQHPEPLKALIDVVMLPWDFLSLSRAQRLVMP